MIGNSKFGLVDARQPVGKPPPPWNAAAAPCFDLNMAAYPPPPPSNGPRPYHHADHGDFRISLGSATDTEPESRHSSLDAASYPSYAGYAPAAGTANGHGSFGGDGDGGASGRVGAADDTFVAIPEPPIVQASAQMRLFVDFGIPAAIPFQGANSILGVRDLSAMAAHGVSAATDPLPSHVWTSPPRSWLSWLFGPPPRIPRRSRVQTEAAEAAGAAPPATRQQLWAQRGMMGAPRARVFVTSHDRRSFLVTNLLLVVLPVLFYIFVAPFAWTVMGPAPVLVAVFLHITATTALFMTSFTDPGIMPRFTSLDYDPHAPGGPRILDCDPIEEVINGIPMQIKYCPTCKILRSPRTFHCSTCDNCVVNHDHHCPWVSNCVGIGNYRYFVTFVTHATLMDTLVVALCIVQLIVDHDGSISTRGGAGSSSGGGEAAANTLRLHPGTVVLLCACGVLLFTLLPLMAYHWYLMLAGLTTHEHTRFAGRAGWRNPWARWQRHRRRRMADDEERVAVNTGAGAGGVIGKAHGSSRSLAEWAQDAGDALVRPLANVAWALCRPLPPSNLRWYDPDEAEAGLRAIESRSAAAAAASNPQARPPSRAYLQLQGNHQQQHVRRAASRAPDGPARSEGPAAEPYGGY